MPIWSARRRATTASTSARGAAPAQRLCAVASGLAVQARSRHDLAEGPTRRWEVHVDEADLQAWMIGWPPGGALELHDHGGSSGLVLVASGVLIETSVFHEAAGVTFRSRAVRPSDEPLVLTKGLVHDVSNWADGPAVSVHVYSPPLTSMTFYEVVEQTLVAQRTEQVGTERVGTELLPAAGRERRAS